MFAAENQKLTKGQKTIRLMLDNYHVVINLRNQCDHQKILKLKLSKLKHDKNTIAGNKGSPKNVFT